MKKQSFRSMERKKDAEFGFDLTPDILDGLASVQHRDRLGREEGLSRQSQAGGPSQQRKQKRS